LRQIASLALLFPILIPPLPAQPDSHSLLDRVIAQVRDTVNRLPRYMCTQTIQRDECQAQRRTAAPPCDSKATTHLSLGYSDRLRLDVASTPAGEIYSWVGESRFNDQGLLGLVRRGSISTGGFSGFLNSIFLNPGARFSSLGPTRLDGRPVEQYSFQVHLESSLYTFGWSHTRVPYEGTFLVDPQTADLLHLVVTVDAPPPATGACKSTTTIDYGRTALNDSAFLLPTRILLDIVNANGSEARNRTVYSGCHEFVGESSVTYGPPQTSLPSPGKDADGPTLSLPANLPFRLAFTHDLDTAGAAAGDTLAASLVTAIEDRSGCVLVPAGTPVIARILRAAHIPLPSSADLTAVTILFRLEALLPGPPPAPRATPANRQDNLADPARRPR